MQIVLLIIVTLVMLGLLGVVWHVSDMSASCREIIGFFCRRIIVSLDRKDGYEDIEIRAIRLSNLQECSESLQRKNCALKRSRLKILER